MPPKQITTLKESLFWSYANLAMAHAAVSEGAAKYGKTHFMIRAKLYAGLKNGTMNLGSIVGDERVKMLLPQACSYCGTRDDLSIDHLLPKSRGGPESSDNVVWACKRCNSSKGATDVLEWLDARDQFPPLLLLRRYLKLAIEWSRRNDVLELPLSDLKRELLPFSVTAIPRNYPQPPRLRLWAVSLGNP